MEHKPKFIRISDLATDKKNGRYGLLPISKATIWGAVKKGKFPQPIKLTDNITAWRLTDIERYMENPNQEWSSL